MKKIFTAAFLTILTITMSSCNQQKVLNRSIKYESGERILTGEFERSALLKKDYVNWYQTEFDSYEVEKSKLKGLKDLRDYRIEVFVGTWCPDSRRELPRLYKILDAIKFPQNRLKVYGVNREKKSFYGEEINKEITHVPTIIVYDKNKNEVGRIVESPVSGYLEEDLAQIVNGTPLTPNYSND
jgi:thiol-disulfide isomerase/thioredoxin